MRTSRPPPTVRRLRVLATFAVALSSGCFRAEPTELYDEGICRTVFGLAEDGDRYIVTRVATENWSEGVTVQAIWPEERQLLPDGAPVVVVVYGGWDVDTVPIAGAERVLQDGLGLIQIYLNLPGGSTAWSTPGEGDFRGPTARRAVLVALQYAQGDIADEDGCTLADRIGVPLSAVPPILHGHSNGGNLALATLADENLVLPPLTGLTFFETPAGPQFVTVEPGTPVHPNPYFNVGSCGWTSEEGLVCDVAYDPATWFPQVRSDDGNVGAVCYDFDEDGVCRSADDLPIWGVRPRIDGVQRTVFSPLLATWLTEQGWPIPDLLDPTSTWEFWATRDASRSAATAMAASPLPAIVVGTTEDHMLAIHDHITGLAWALQNVGSPWVRVNPDAVYLHALVDEDQPWSDNPANAVTGPGDLAVSLEPDDAESSTTLRATVSAAAVELFERRYTGTWTNDVDAPLLE